jgi:hypothetical protein
VQRTGELVGIDCFYVGRLRGTDGASWQLTAIDIASSYAWAQLVICKQGNPPTARQASKLARVARVLKTAGWRLERMLSDNGNEFRGSDFTRTLQRLKARNKLRPRSQTTDQRRRRGAAQDDPRRVLASRLRPLPLSALHRAEKRARRLRMICSGVCRVRSPRWSSSRPFLHGLTDSHTRRTELRGGPQGHIPADIVYRARKMEAR